MDPINIHMEMSISMKSNTDSKHQKWLIGKCIKRKKTIKIATQTNIYSGINLTEHIKKKIIMKYYRRT